MAVGHPTRPNRSPSRARRSHGGPGRPAPHRALRGERTPERHEASKPDASRGIAAPGARVIRSRGSHPANTGSRLPSARNPMACRFPVAAVPMGGIGNGWGASDIPGGCPARSCGRPGRRRPASPDSRAAIRASSPTMGRRLAFTTIAPCPFGGGPLPPSAACRSHERGGTCYHGGRNPDSRLSGPRPRAGSSLGMTAPHDPLDGCSRF